MAGPNQPLSNYVFGGLDLSNTANSLVLETRGYSSIGIQLSTALAGSIQVEETNVLLRDAVSTDWVPVSGRAFLTTGAVTIHTDGLLLGYMLNARFARVRPLSTAVTISTVRCHLSSTVNIITNSSVTQSGTWTVQPGNTQNTTPWLTKEQRSTTPTVTSVASSATNVTLLALNTSRLGATIFNESTQILYLKLGATSSLTSYTLQVAPGAYYEVPFYYTGIIDGIWTSANGNARVTQIL